MVTNGEWRPGQTAVGGGQPIAPNCAYNAGATNVAAPSTGQSSGGSAAAPAPSQPQPSAGNDNAGSQSGSPSGPDWEQAVRFWNWAQMAVPNMRRFAPGTPQHEQAKTNYERNIDNYIKAAARAGVVVDANTPPESVVAGSNAGSTSGGSTGQSSGGSAAAPAPSQQQSSGNNAGSQSGTPSGPDWEQAVRFWNWAQSARPNMERFAPGTPEHERAKTNYQRNIDNYITAAARAGVVVDANTPPESVVAGSNAGSSSGGSASSQTVNNTGGNQSASANSPPQSGSDEARYWHRAIQFWNWAEMARPNMERFAPGTPQHEQAKTNYERNIDLYIRYAARAGVTVNASTPPDQAFDRA